MPDWTPEIEVDEAMARTLIGAQMPALAARLPAPISAPRWVGRPAAAYPWPFFGARLLPGAEPTTAFADAARQRLAPRLGAFLRELHAVRPHDELPHDPLGRADMGRRVPFAAGRLDELAALRLHAPFAALRA